MMRWTALNNHKATKTIASDAQNSAALRNANIDCRAIVGQDRKRVVATAGGQRVDCLTTTPWARW